ncbi:MAG: hypothetical protein K2Y71_06175 [Xanthobacteraceae bacterium]|nr:hypothetical protein [Xanthobacteraceae bacterium]
MAALLGVFAGPVLAEASLDEVLREYDSPESADSQRRLITSYLAGIGLGLGWSNTALRAQGKQAHLYCPSNDHETTPPELIDILRGALEAEPRLRDQPIGFALLIALQRTFPCDLTRPPPQKKAGGGSRRTVLRARPTVKENPASRSRTTQAVSNQMKSSSDEDRRGSAALFAPPVLPTSSDGESRFRVPPVSPPR